MKCRFCDKELINGKDRQFETLSDHVCNPNSTEYPKRNIFECCDKECVANKVSGFWDEMGDFYYDYRKQDIIPKGRNSANGSYARQMEIEIEKHDEDFFIWKGIKYCIEIKFEYMADEYGNILKRIPKIHILRRYFDSIKDIFDFIFKKKRNFILIYDRSNISMLKFCKNRYKRKINRIKQAFKENNIDESIIAIREIHEEIKNSKKYQEWDEWDEWRNFDFKRFIYGNVGWYRPLYRKWVEKDA